MFPREFVLLSNQPPNLESDLLLARQESTSKWFGDAAFFLLTFFFFFNSGSSHDLSKAARALSTRLLISFL